MVASHVHDALGQVRRLRELIIEKRGFRGYSGIARIAGGCCALAAGMCLGSPLVPPDWRAHLFGWVLVLLVSAAPNYGALAYWFANDPSVGRDFTHILPATDALAPLAVGGVATVALTLHGNRDLLFGLWGSLYGVAHIAHRHSLPKENYLLGMAYICCGSVLLLAPPDFSNPWPMAILFAAGETMGGLVFLNMQRAE
jgi:hypothetical protein